MTGLEDKSQVEKKIGFDVSFVVDELLETHIAGHELVVFDEALQILLPDHGLPIGTIRKLRRLWNEVQVNTKTWWVPHMKIETRSKWEYEMRAHVAIPFLKPLLCEAVQTFLAEERERMKLYDLQSKVWRMYDPIRHAILEKKLERCHESVTFYERFLALQTK